MKSQFQKPFVGSISI